MSNDLSPEPKLPFARMMHDVNQHELCVLTPSQWKYIRENWESQSRRNAELESLVAIYKGRDEGKQLVINQLEQPRPETGGANQDDRLPAIRERHRKGWIGIGDSEKYQTQPEKDRKALLEIIDNMSRPPPAGYESWYDAAVDERIKRIAAEKARSVVSGEQTLLIRALKANTEMHSRLIDPTTISRNDHPGPDEYAILPADALRKFVDEDASINYEFGQLRKCPHGLPLAENICGPCSKGRPNKPSPPPQPETPESCNVERTGVYVNTGYSHTASGHIVRDGNYWVATFKLGSEADDYVARMNKPSPPPTELLEAAWRKYGRHLHDCRRYGQNQCTCGFVETCVALRKSVETSDSQEKK